MVTFLPAGRAPAARRPGPSRPPGAARPAHADVDWARRIVLECLALSMTSCHPGSDGWRTSVRALAAMDAAAGEGDPRRWSTAHRAFHRGLLSGCGDPLTQLLAALPDHAEQAPRPTAEPWATDAGEHTILLDALARGDLADAVAVLARHLADSGAPGVGPTVGAGLPTAVCRAVELVSHPRRGARPTPT